MGILLLTGVDGNLGGEAARILLELAPHDQLIFWSLLDPGSMRSTSEPSAGQRRPRRPHAVLACMRSPSSRFLRLAVAMASMTSRYSAEGWIRLCRGTTMSEHLR